MNHRQEHFIDRRNGGNHSIFKFWCMKHKDAIRTIVAALALVALVCGTAYLDKQADIKIQELKKNENR